MMTRPVTRHAKDAWKHGDKTVYLPWPKELS